MDRVVSIPVEKYFGDTRKQEGLQHPREMVSFVVSFMFLLITEAWLLYRLLLND
jgi:hypothetical protein